MYLMSLETLDPQILLRRRAAPSIKKPNSRRQELKQSKAVSERLLEKELAELRAAERDLDLIELETKHLRAVDSIPPFDPNPRWLDRRLVKAQRAVERKRARVERRMMRIMRIDHELAKVEGRTQLFAK